MYGTSTDGHQPEPLLNLAEEKVARLPGAFLVQPVEANLVHFQIRVIYEKRLREDPLASMVLRSSKTPSGP